MGKVHASLFSGFGAADLAATWMGWDNAFWCEIDDFPRTVLSYWFPKSKGYGNIKETDFTPWRGKIDVLTGGFPCQPFSVAGQRKGQEDDRYLWPEMLRAIREIRPTWIVGENVGGILSMVQPGNEVTVESQASLFEEADKETILEQEYVVETVCRDLEQEGYSVQPVVIPACSVEAPHIRYRVFFIAHRSDARAESVQREGKDGVHGFNHFAYANSHDAGRSGYEPVGREAGKGEARERQRERVRGNIERTGAERTIADSKCTGRGQVRQEIQSEQPDGNSFNSVGYEWNAPYAYNVNGNLSRLCTGWISQLMPSGVFKNRRDWRNFPTQSPVCRGNDGLPFDVVRLTISLTAWCTGSIKGYGNAIVPQVMYEIFKAIETIKDLKTTSHDR